MRSFPKTLFLLLLLCRFSQAEGGPDVVSDKPVVTFGGFLDTFYACDFNSPTGLQRTYGSPNQPVTTAGRHNEFGINLAFVDAKITSENVHGRLALQAGSSVDATYAAESVASPTGGPLVRMLQEAYVGYRIAGDVWVDAGIYLSHIGLESFISRDNWNYTRAYMADFSPYYEAGVRLSYQPKSPWSFQFHLLNGWQNIIETNGNKAVGTQIAYSPSPRVALIYNTFLGAEVGAMARYFNDFIVKLGVTKELQLAASVDIGFEQGPKGTSSWYGASLLAQYAISPRVSIAGRVERYSDPDRAIVQPVNPAIGFNANGVSLNLDTVLAKGLVWRNETRFGWSPDAVFASGSGYVSQDWLIVTSMSYSL